MTESYDPRQLAVLGYHKIGDPPLDGWQTWYYVPEDVFLLQLCWLRDTGWRFIDKSTFLCSFKEPQILPEKAALITFDDGYLSMATTALRCLRQFECPAVLFVPTDFIGQENIWDQGSEPRELLCGWKELRELERNGVSIQSHAASHRWLSKLDLQCQEQELTRSKAVLEDGLNKTVELLAYPFGAPVSDLALVGRAGYSAAFIYGGPGSLLSGPIGDRYRIARIAMGPDTNLASILSQP